MPPGDEDLELLPWSHKWSLFRKGLSMQGFRHKGPAVLDFVAPAIL